MAKRFPEVSDFINAGESDQKCQRRLNIVRRAYAELAFERATNPQTPLGEAIEAGYRSWQLTEILSETPDAEISHTETDLWSLLSEQERMFATKAIVTMAGVWGVEHTDFSLISTVDNNGLETFTVIYAADIGIDPLRKPEIHAHSSRDWDSALGFRRYENGKGMVSCAEIMVDQQRVDTRAGVTDAALTALATHNPNIHEVVWRINSPELVDHDLAPVAFLSDGQVTFAGLHPDCGEADILLRPAVVVATRQRPLSA